MVTMFCDIDDFCRPLLTARYPQLEAASHPSKRHSARLTRSQVMTILVFFPASHYRTFKHFYFAHMRGQRRGEFPRLPRYTRFVELIPLTLLPLCASVPTRKGPVTGLQFIDSLPIRVCHNRRIGSHTVLAGLAQRGKGSRGWFYGLKLPLVMNEQGEVLGLTLTPGHTDDRRPGAKLVRPLWGQRFGDRG